MVANLKSLLIPIAPAPTVDTSWLDNLTKAAGGAIDQASQNKSFGRLADQIGGSPATAQQPGFLSRLFGGGQQPNPVQTAATAAPGASSQVAATTPGSGDYYSAIRAAESGGNDSATNPNSSATGRYQFTSGTWDNVAKAHPELGLTPDGRLDPNQQELAIRAFTQDNAKSLASSGIPVTPGNLYAAHFLGAGGAKRALVAPDNSPLSAYVDPSVVTSNPSLSNMSVGQFKQWTASKGGNGSGGYGAPAADAINAAAPPSGSVVAPPANAPAGQGQTQVASLDPRAGMASAPAPAPFDPATASPTAMMQQLGLNSPAPGQTPYRDPMVTTAGQQPQGQQPSPGPVPPPAQVAQNAPAGAPANAGPSMIAPGVTPASRQNVSNDMIASMVRDPNTRQAGLQLWQQVLTGKGAEPWQFVQLPDGTLARANQQTGEVQSVGKFAKPLDPLKVGQGETVLDPITHQPVYQAQPKTPESYQEFQLAQQNGFAGSYADWEKVKTPGLTVNNAAGENATSKAAGEGLGKLFSGIFDAGMTAKTDKAQVDLLRSSLAQSPTGVLGALAGAASDYGINVGPNADKVQVAKAIIAKMVPAQRIPGSGTNSDRDLVQFQNGLPRLSGTPEGNGVILDTLDALANFKSAQADVVTRYYAGDIDQKQAVKELQGLPDPYAAYKNFTASQGGNTDIGGNGASGAGAPRRAYNPATKETLELRDGAWVKVN